MSAVRVDTNGAASGVAPDQSQEQDVRIPVEVDETAEDQTAGAADAATDDAAGAEAAEPCVYRLGGNSCLSGDFMGLWRFPAELNA